MMDNQKSLLGQLLLENGIINENQLNEALSEQKKNHARLGKILIHKKWAEETDILFALSRQFQIPVVNLLEYKVDSSLSKKIPAKFAYRYKILPLKLSDNKLTAAVTDPLDLHAIDDLRLLLECDIKPVLCREKEILKALKKMYGVGAETLERMKEDDSDAGHKDALAESGAVGGVKDEDAAIIQFVNQIINEAHKDRATDIHIEPFEDDMIIRYRIDGILHEIPIPHTVKRYQTAIISRIKIMANMNIAEKRLPQDGRIRFKIGKEDIDLRVSTLPVIHGESIDIRILPRTQMLLGLEKLGLPENYMHKIEKLIKKPHGIILVTGPTGHGKTTTLYACLNCINSVDKKIITIEDPIEYQLKGINQIPIQANIGLTFAKGLRSILRQDPDVIMVGEIRDQETAEISIRASLTGHLVFSTLHTNDAPGAITRLIDMGIEPYLVSSSIEAIIAQRLVRLLCGRCKKTYKPDKTYLKSIGFPLNCSREIYKAGPGCEECRHTGYKGRTGVYELICLDEDLKSVILSKGSTSEIRKSALKKGMLTLRSDGWQKVMSGLTTIDEIIRIAQEEEIDQ